MTQTEFAAYYHLDYSGSIAIEDLYRWCDEDRDGYLTVYEFKHCYCHEDEYQYVEPIIPVDQCTATANNLFEAFNDLDDDEELLSREEFQGFFEVYFQTSDISETLYDYCDYDGSGLLSEEEFAACYCNGFYEPHEEGPEIDECLMAAGTEFALIDTAAIDNVGKLSKHEFAIFWNAVSCNSSSVDDLYNIYDADSDELLSYEEFAGLFCNVECDGGVHMDHMHYVVEQVHGDSHEC